MAFSTSRKQTKQARWFFASFAFLHHGKPKMQVPYQEENTAAGPSATTYELPALVETTRIKPRWAGLVSEWMTACEEVVLLVLITRNQNGCSRSMVILWSADRRPEYR